MMWYLHGSTIAKSKDLAEYLSIIYNQVRLSFFESEYRLFLALTMQRYLSFI